MEISTARDLDELVVLLPEEKRSSKKQKMRNHQRLDIWFQIDMKIRGIKGF